jgi:hypothetical protein
MKEDGISDMSNDKKRPCLDSDKRLDRTSDINVLENVRDV